MTKQFIFVSGAFAGLFVESLSRQGGKRGLNWGSRPAIWGTPDNRKAWLLEVEEKGSGGFEEGFEFGGGDGLFLGTDDEGFVFADEDGDAATEGEEFTQVGAQEEDLEVELAHVLDLEGLHGGLEFALDPTVGAPHKEASFDKAGVLRALVICDGLVFHLADGAAGFDGLFAGVGAPALLEGVCFFLGGCSACRRCGLCGGGAG